MLGFFVNLLVTILLAVLKVVCLLVAIAYFTLAERKIMAAVQRRVGPNVVGPFGLLQPLADGLKLAGKELAIPTQASSRIFLTVAMSVLLFALSGWAAIPFGLFDHSEHMNDRTMAYLLMVISGDTSQDYLEAILRTLISTSWNGWGVSMRSFVPIEVLKAATEMSPMSAEGQISLIEALLAGIQDPLPQEVLEAVAAECRASGSCPL